MLVILFISVESIVLRQAFDSLTGIGCVDQSPRTEAGLILHWPPLGAEGLSSMYERAGKVKLPTVLYRCPPEEQRAHGALKSMRHVNSMS